VEVLARGIRRLTHFTPARNLPNILRDMSIRSTQEMQADKSAVYAATDPARYDGQPDKICCSIEYPNIYYLRKARERPDATNYPDWACLLLAAKVAAKSGTLFCVRNASVGRGALLAAGVASLRGCYAPKVSGSGGSLYTRGPSHLASAPTDIQAEVLVPGPLPLSTVQAIALPSAALVAQERGRLLQFGLNPDIVRWIAAPGLFQVDAILSAIQGGVPIQETPWTEEPEAQV